MARAYIGLGSNLGDREVYLSAAKKCMADAGIHIVSESPIDETDPVEFTQQPRFLNQIVCVETDSSPGELLEILLTIELSLGRVRTISKGPRIIDLDILLFEERIIDEDNLVIPHAGILSRGFIIKQLLYLDPDMRDPRTGKLFREVSHE